MKNNTLRFALVSLLLVVTLAGCGPAYVGVGTGPAYPAYGYYAPRPYYPLPYYSYRRPPVYVAPPRVYYSRPRYYSRPTTAIGTATHARTTTVVGGGNDSLT